MGPGLELRREPRVERRYRQNVGDVYHYALGVLSDPLDAEEVTRATFQNAARHRDDPDLNSLLTIAHEVCRMRGGHERLVETDLPGRPPASPCEAVELAICRETDGVLPRRERRGLRSHLATCDRCRAFAELQRAQRTAISALSQIPLPPSLVRAARPRRPRLRLAAQLCAVAGTVALILTLAASGGIPGPSSFIGQEQGPEAEARVVEKKAKRKFPRRKASP